MIFEAATDVGTWDSGIATKPTYTEYIRGDRVLLKKQPGSAKLYYYLYNGRGDVIGILNDDGSTANTYDYDPFGHVTEQQEQTDNAFKYEGEYLDADTGLYYLHARYYDPSIGRFINEDTYEGQINNPLSQNVYTYVHNNPLIYIDPTGHDNVLTSGGGGGNDYGYWEKEWNAFVAVNSNWYTAVDYWSGDALTFLNDYYKISQEKPLSVEQFVAAGYLVFELIPGTKVEAKLSKKGISYIDTAISKAAKGCNCFTAGTKVQTDEGEKNIEDIEVGDKVLSKDEETGKVEYKEVTDTFNHETDEIYKIYVGGQIIESTFNHPFYVKNKGWTYVKDLKIGDLLVESDSNTLKVRSIELLHKQVTVYNLTVNEFHTYFVSDLGIWVHNDSCSHKTPKSGVSGKEAAKDVPSWARGEKPMVGENGNAFAKRLLDEKYGAGNYKTGPGTEYNKIKKWGDRGFE